MASRLGSSSLPLLAPDATFTRSDGELTVEAGDMIYTFHGASATLFEAVRDRLEGSVEIAAFAASVDVSPATMVALLEPMAEDGNVLDAREALDASTPARFMEAYRRICALWRRELHQIPFWPTIMSGRASQNLVLGWGIEFYHYVESANEHMAAAVAYCRTDPIARQWLARHYVDEHDHAAMFLDGLAACGLKRELVRRAPPLGTTRALINYLTELATTDTLAYAGAFAVMRDSEPFSATAHAVYDDLVAHYGFAAGLLEVVRQHAALDHDMKHDTLVIERILERNGCVTPDGARRILAGARGLIEHFVLFFEGIYDAYERSTGPQPRRAIDARALVGMSDMAG